MMIRPQPPLSHSAPQALQCPLPELPRNGWHPLAERLSYRDQTPDEDLIDLMHLGISPQPRVVLAIEGETEQIHVPLIWKQLDYPDAPELLRLLMLGGVDRDLEEVAALAAAPPDRPEGPEPEPGLAAYQAAHLSLHRHRPRAAVLRPG